MTEYTPMLDEIRNGYISDHTNLFSVHQPEPRLTVMQEHYEAAFDRWLSSHEAKVRAEVLIAAAETVHAEARWQLEGKMRGAVQKSGAETAVERLLVVEELLRDEAEYWQGEAEANV